MPGISFECEIGAHEQCAMGLECRCPHHAHTQALLRKGPNKAEGKGGINRKVRKKIQEAAALLPEVSGNGEPSSELRNTCPKCKGTFAPTDQFCRKDGTRLCMGHPCERCNGPCEEADLYCWQCGWKLGDPLPIVETEIAARPVEEVKRELRAKLIEKGYAVPDTLV